MSHPEQTEEYLRRIDEAAHHLNGLLDEKPTVGVVLGSGLGSFADYLERTKSVDYVEIPQWPKANTGVEGHAGKLIHGPIDGKACLILSGRYHLYEGHSPQEATFGIRVLGQLGIKTLIVTNAAGGISQELMPGDLMLISDHLNLQATSPLEGENLANYGPRFVDMTESYDASLRVLFQEVAKEQGIDLKEGIYAATRGPQYETPAEVRMLGRLGADAIGMSTVPEVIVAKHMGMKVLGVSCITNLAAGRSGQGMSHSEVLEVGAASGSFLARLLHAFIARLPE